jgi:N-acetylglutamate synthase-like GNAT family acetyltransferase
MTIRNYRQQDKPHVITLMRLNIPKYFDASEEPGFVNYLDHEREDYFVVETDGKLIGAGGINYEDDGQTGIISWDMIHPDYQGKGIGRALTQHRLDVMYNKPELSTIRVRTTQLTDQFYAKMGFQLERTEKDFWAKGLDLYQMRMNIQK